MERQNKQRECGSVEVEVTFILPIVVLSVVMLLYLALFLFQRAVLQASLETALVYYKNTVTDNYVTRNDSLGYDRAEEGVTMGAGNSYAATNPLNPYRGFVAVVADNIGGESVTGGFESYFKSVAGRMLFEKDLKITIDYTNYVFVKEFRTSAVQTVRWPLDLSILGVGEEYQISAAARVAVTDHDAIIRDADYAIDLLEETKLGEFAEKVAGKVGEAYEKMKDILKFGE